MKKIHIILAAATVIFLTQNASAQVFLSAALSPTHSSTNNGTPDPISSTVTPVNDKTASGLDSRLSFGYLYLGQVFFGASYNFSSNSVSREADAFVKDSTDNHDSRQEYGPTVGWGRGGFLATFTYLISAKETFKEKSFDVSGVRQFDDEAVYSGHGIQVHLAWLYSIGTNFRFGPSLTYYSVSYNKVEYTDNTDPLNNVIESLTKNSKASDLLPMLSLALVF